MCRDALDLPILPRNPCRSSGHTLGFLFRTHVMHADIHTHCAHSHPQCTHTVLCTNCTAQAHRTLPVTAAPTTAHKRTHSPANALTQHARTPPAPQHRYMLHVHCACIPPAPQHRYMLHMHCACTPPAPQTPLHVPHALCMTCTQAQCTLSTLHPQRHTRHPTPHLHTHGGPQLCSGVPLLSSQKPPEQARGVVAGMAGMSQTEEELKPPNQNTPRPGAP